MPNWEFIPSSPEKAGIKKGVLGGVVMMIFAAASLIVGFQAGHIIYYYPILFVIALYALIKGIWQGNIDDNKK